MILYKFAGIIGIFILFLIWLVICLHKKSLRKEMLIMGVLYYPLVLFQKYFIWKTIPKKFYSFLKELTPKFIDTKYPDASIDLPSHIYDKQITERLLKETKEVLKLIETRFS